MLLLLYPLSGIGGNMATTKTRLAGLLQVSLFARSPAANEYHPEVTRLIGFFFGNSALAGITGFPYVSTALKSSKRAPTAGRAGVSVFANQHPRRHAPRLHGRLVRLIRSSDVISALKRRRQRLRSGQTLKLQRCWVWGSAARCSGSTTTILKN